MNTFSFRIISNSRITDTCYDMRISAHELTAVQPGQFVHVKCDGFTLRRPISVCDFNGKVLRMVVDRRGSGTEWLTNRPVGTVLDLLAPLGRGFDTLGEQVLVVGGGIGVPPLLYAAKSAAHADAILGFRTSSAVILLDDFKSACRTVQVCTDDGTFGAHGRVDSLVAERLKSQTYDRVLSCGPLPMLKALKRVCESASVPLQVSLEERMGCGVGACLVCACKLADTNGFKYGHVCKDGPVFNASEVVFDD